MIVTHSHRCDNGILRANNRKGVHLRRRPDNQFYRRIPTTRECISSATSNGIDYFCTYSPDNLIRRLDLHNSVCRHIVESTANMVPLHRTISHRICIANSCTNRWLRRCHRCNAPHCRTLVIGPGTIRRYIGNGQDNRAFHNRLHRIRPNIERSNHNVR